jgi:molybdopterin synthase sulfur carrier subunit
MTMRATRHEDSIGDEGAMRPLRVEIRLFGAFRQYSSGASVSFDVPQGTLVSEVRSRLLAALDRDAASPEVRQLVNASVIADDSRILDETQELGAGQDVVSLAVLPPVCGG